MYIYKAEVLKVIDGDTLELKVDLGFNAFCVERIRLLGIDAFETRTKDPVEKIKGLEIKRRLTDFLSVYKDVFLKSTKDQTFNRWLGDVFIDKELNKNIVVEISKWMQELSVK